VLQKTHSQPQQQPLQQQPTIPSQPSFYQSQEQQPQGQPVLSKSSSQPFTRDLLGWQSPIRQSLPDQNVDNLNHTIPEKIGRKGSDYTGTGSITKSSTLQQTQFWRLQQQLQQQPQGRILITNGGIPIQKSASATYPSQSTSFQSQSIPQQPQQPQQPQPSHRLRRGMSSVQSVVVK